MSERIFENLGLKFFFKKIPDINSIFSIQVLEYVAYFVFFFLPIPKLISSSFCVGTHAKSFGHFYFVKP
jgi:hypothetical protein